MLHLSVSAFSKPLVNRLQMTKVRPQPPAPTSLKVELNVKGMSICSVMHHE